MIDTYRLEEVISGSPFENDEKEEIIEEISKLEECSMSEEELANLPDGELASYAIDVISEYARSHF